MLKQKYADLNELISFFVTEMNERNYEKDVIDEWVVYIKENHEFIKMKYSTIFCILSAVSK
jgi:hypothetical protein